MMEETHGSQVPGMFLPILIDPIKINHLCKYIVYVTGPMNLS